MKKALCAITILAIMMVVSPVLAQGPFTDVPTDHWAYEAVTQLAQDGIIVGYPDGTFGGKRAMTRFEFAQALARAIPVIAGKVTPGGAAGVSSSDFNALKDRVTALESKSPADTSAFATKADVDALKKLTDEFRDELAAMGVDIDALKRDVAALNTRVTAIENELDRVKINGEANVFAIGEDVSDGIPVDRDERVFHPDDDLLESLSFVKEIDLGIRGRVGDKASVYTMINAGNYLNYLGSVDDYAGGLRPTDAADGFFPYYLYADSPLWSGSVAIGRLPIQWTPYTLRKIDVDSYTVNKKTDTGDYPIDGISGSWKWGGVGLQAFAAKTTNEFLANGLTSQSTAGLFNDTGLVAGGAPFNAVGGHAMGGLTSIDQFAGARATLGTPFKGTLGLSYMEAAGPAITVPVLGSTFDSARLMGANLNFELGAFSIGGEWAQVDTLATVGDDLDGDNTALDANIGFGIGGLGVKGGWKSIDRNFSAPGFWDKLGRWTNPTNIEGPYVDLKYGLTTNVSLVAAAEFLSAKDTFLVLPDVMDDEDDDVQYYNAGLRWGLSASTSVDLGMEWVKWDPTGGDTTDEKYINIGFGYQFSPNMGAKIGYQIADYDAAAAGAVPYGADYKGNLAVAQVSVKF